MSNLRKRLAEKLTKKADYIWDEEAYNQVKPNMDAIQNALSQMVAKIPETQTYLDNFNSSNLEPVKALFTMFMKELQECEDSFKQVTQELSRSFSMKF